MDKLSNEQIQDVYDFCVKSLSDPDGERGFFEFLCEMEEDYQPEKVFIQLIDRLRFAERNLLQSIKEKEIEELKKNSLKEMLLKVILMQQISHGNGQLTHLRLECLCEDASELIKSQAEINK